MVNGSCGQMTASGDSAISSHEGGHKSMTYQSMKIMTWPQRPRAEA